MPTVADVARRAGVSTATVSRALNSPAVVAAPTLARVTAAIEALGYVPNTAARRLAGGATGALGLLLPGLAGPWFSELLAGVEATARAAGRSLLVSAIDPEGPPAADLAPADPAFVDGTIILPHAVTGAAVDRLARQGRPVVLVERTHPVLPTVSFDPATGIREAIRHLALDHGAREIACLAGPSEAEASVRREMRWAAELLALDLVPRRELLIHGTWSEASGMEMALALLAAGRRFDAILTASDETAIGALAGLAQAGRRVPEDVPVIGFDDIPPAAWTRPALTTVAAPA